MSRRDRVVAAPDAAARSFARTVTPLTLDRRQVLAAAALLGVPGCGRAATLAGATRLEVRDDRIFIAVRVGGVATTAVIDSAAELTVLDRSFAERLGLRGGAPVTARGTGAATTTATLVAGIRIEVAGRVLTPATMAVIDLGELARRIGMRVDVILGRDLFDAERLALDLAGGTLRNVSGDSDPAGVALPLTPRRGIETIPLTLEGVAAVADFDLGNGGTMLVGAAFAARHHLLDRVTGTIPGGGIGGPSREATLTLATLDLAGHRFHDVPAAIDSSPTAADANVGVRLLRRYAIVTDFPARRVWLDWRG